MKEALYSTYKDGEYIGDFKAVELHEKIGINAKTLYGYVTSNLTYKKHYTFKRKYPSSSTSMEELTDEELCREWDKTRKMLNPQAE